MRLFQKGDHNLSAFVTALFFIFAAEMGDKTQLVAMAFATRYKPSTVLAGVTVATLIVHLLSVFLGEAASWLMPVWLIQAISGIAFIIFGIWTLKGDSLDEKETQTKRNFGPFLTVAITFFLAELGDKTMLATVTIASQQRDFIPVWLGSTVGMVLADGLAIIVGQILGKKLPEKTIQYCSAAIFIITGIYTLAQPYMKL
jgi:Ca2+/H+ antiporter, TMEM165/GDT1 family